jgi:hypothetical protein
LPNAGILCLLPLLESVLKVGHVLARTRDAQLSTRERLRRANPRSSDTFGQTGQGDAGEPRVVERILKQHASESTRRADRIVPDID